MNPNPHHFLTIATLIFLFLVGWISCGKTQSSTLGRLYKTKYHNGKLNQECCHNSHINSTVDWRQRVKRELKGERERDRIEKLPGQPPVKFQQYGGYVTVDKRIGRDFYYYFAEADLSKKDSLPLLLWLNGGPGCSSLGYGAMQEIGPFRVNSDGKTLFRNRFAWNHAANVLFLESPAGVGFSYSNRTTDYETAGDKRTAGDNYMFLLNWLQRFPEYKHRDLYIAGESYAGHYVPQLANVILTHNNKPYNTHHRINLKGILIGNAAINDETDLKGMYEYFWTHNLISDEVANRISKKCDFSPSATGQSSECEDATDEAEIDVQDIDIYNIYAPLCVSSNLTSKPKRPSQVIDPCSDAYVYAYLNSPQVQKALHANLTHLHYDWQPCSEVITTWGDSPPTILPVLKELLHNGLRVWIFSGDTDGRIPVTSTKMSINEMRVPIKTPWHPWYIKGEVGGYTQEYEGGLTFTTVRGAGHQVPSYQPLRALSLIFHFLGGTSLPNSSKNTFLQP